MKSRLVPFFALLIITNSFCYAQNSTLLGISGGGMGGLGTIFQTNTTGSAFKSDYSFYIQATYPEGDLIQANNGLLYGMTNEGGAKNAGLIFSYDILTKQESDIYDFGGGKGGAYPKGSLIQLKNGLLYGLTSAGGTYDGGTIFSYDITTGTETNLYDFGGGTDGKKPCGSLILINDSLVYGTTYAGGVDSAGIIFSYNIFTGTETDLHDFGRNNDGKNPKGSLIQASKGVLYGLTYDGGTYNGGTIFRYNVSTGIEIDFYNFAYGTDGSNPFGSLIQGGNGLLYGLTAYGGTYYEGTIFSYNTSSGTETVLYNFGFYTDGAIPYGSLIKLNDTMLYGMTAGGGVVGNGEGTIFSYNTVTGAETDIYDFGNGTDGQQPYGSLIQGSNGLLYGMTYFGGNFGYGTVFNYNISTGTESDIYNFGVSPNGYNPSGPLIQASNGLVYGTTVDGGAKGYGLIFSYNISTGAYTDIYDCVDMYDGELPGTIIQASNGLLYGTTFEGGANNVGNIFSYNISTGKEINLHDFYGPDGSLPSGPLFQASDSLLYGMTYWGGTSGLDGVIFSYNISTGQEAVIHDFNYNGTDGYSPQDCSLIQANDGLLYGIVPFGGTYNGGGIIFSYDISNSEYTILHDFGYGTDGNSPVGSLIQASNGLLYGTTEYGGTDTAMYYTEGTIFSYDISTGIETDIHDFGYGTDGSFPVGSLVQANDSLLYGTTNIGGVNDSGMIFSYNISTGIETDIHDFTGNDGKWPWGALIKVDTSISTRINQLSVNNNQLSIYPNPTPGQFTIKTNSNQNGYMAVVYNIIGEEIYQSVINNLENRINLSSQPAGMYFVYLKSEEGVEVGKVLLAK